MNSQGLILENVHPIAAFVPINTTGAGQDGDWINLKKARRICALLFQGAWAGGTCAITMEQAQDNTGAANKALSFDRYWYATALTTDVWTEVAVTTDTFTIGTANRLTAIEVIADQMDTINAFTHVRVRAATPGGNADLLAGLYLVGSMFFDAYPTRLQTKID